MVPGGSSFDRGDISSSRAAFWPDKPVDCLDCLFAGVPLLFATSSDEGTDDFECITPPTISFSPDDMDDLLLVFDGPNNFLKRLFPVLLLFAASSPEEEFMRDNESSSLEALAVFVFPRRNIVLLLLSIGRPDVAYICGSSGVLLSDCQYFQKF